MDRGLYTAASGGLARTRELDIVSNNLANVNTVGFKAQRIVTATRDFADTLTAQLAQGDPSARQDFAATPEVTSVGTATDFSQGPIRQTDNPFDVALTDENAFFVVLTPEGEQLTRAGNFTMDAERTIVSAEGFPISGAGGQITLQPGAVSITNNGSIVVDGNTQDTLRVVRVENLQNLERAEGARFTLANGGQAQEVETISVIPGAVEMPNINPVEAMVQLITTQRAFESYQKTVRTIDELSDTQLRTARR